MNGRFSTSYIFYGLVLWGVLVFVITKTKKGSLLSRLRKLRPLNLSLNLTKNSVERIGQKIIWQIRPILVTIYLHISTDSILGGLSFRDLEN